MRYRDVLELTPRQLEAILSETSDPPGLLQLETIQGRVESLRGIYGRE